FVVLFIADCPDLSLDPSDRSSNLYTIALNKVASNSSTCLLEKAYSSQSWLWHQRLSHLNFAIVINIVKSNLVQDEASEVIISFIKKTQMNLQLQVQRVRTDNGTELKTILLLSSLMRESSSSSLKDDVQQSPEEVILPQTNTQSISNNMVPNVDEASTSHNVFNERLEDAYFDASALFHDPSVRVNIFLYLVKYRSLEDGRSYKEI
nr:integrase, catalytic region, zinc finger, CCHC-type, peptidase aspartic, catalytic [Tanacetum cinerariifolium]